MDINQATVNELEEVANLFNLYRMFYKQPSNIDGARAYIKERFQNNDSIIFLATNNGKPVGFTQLYPTFSSVSMKKVWILNDLYVAQEGRNQGVATHLLQKAKEFALETGAIRLELSTAFDNNKAQRLYEKFGFKRESQFYRYELPIA
ncbi:GNAT family N-acetyltransferase [Metabacillus niabensis]|uniref:GNAT superfamily N-acetyltransferase n=1 Tax=Metabacillus niabensis TaxID=324854 RepID=A0ABT9Z562_9BACI|nr:GNAT family N-acetyltransferase [Metabacillus niabensis]MDQ0227401.1 GNAT superfamily N-acetyltransferase [Metabacillus niabensis]